MNAQIDTRLTWHGVTAMVLLLATMILTACPSGGGKGGGGGWEDKARSDLRAERGSSSSGAYAQKWGLPKK